MLKQISVSSDRNLIKNFILCCSHLVLKKVSFRKIIKKIDAIGLMYKDESFDDYANVVWTAYGNRDFISGKSILKTIRLPFENVDFDAFVGYDTWLRTIYNDYMQLPPEDKRVTHHAFKAYWK